MDIFPSSKLPTALLRWRPIDSFISGPESIFGEVQRRNPRPGFRWMAEMSSIFIGTPEQASLWEALLIGWRMGSELTVVPRLGGPLAMGLTGTGAILTTHSDGSSFSDGALYSQPEATAVLAAPIALGATTATIVVAGNRRLRGGECFSLTGETYGKRLYGISRIASAPADDVAEGTYVVSFGPNAREAYADASLVDVATPGCVMRPNLEEGDRMWPTYEPGWFTRVGVTFVETFNMSDDGDV